MNDLRVFVNNSLDNYYGLDYLNENITTLETYKIDDEVQADFFYLQDSMPADATFNKTFTRDDYGPFAGD